MGLTVAALLVGVGAFGATPTNNPIASLYAEGGGAPAWSDTILWSRVVDMSRYGKGATDFEKFENARDELAAQGGGVLCYPAGTYDFTDMPADGVTRVGKGGNSMILGEFVPDTVILFDYGKTCGIDVNKQLMGPFEGGFHEEGVIVRDNWVFNHGHRGFDLAGRWMTVANNRNERIYLKGGAGVYGLGEGWTLTLDGNLRSNAGGNGAISDNLSRAFDLAGAHLWIDRNWFNNAGSNPGNDGEGILCQAHGGTQLTGWAITRNTHVKGSGQSSYMGSWDVEQNGCLIAWNETPGWVGVINVGKRAEVDCAYVANKAGKVNAKPPTTLGQCPPGPPAPPKNVTATRYAADAVHITWEDAGDNEIGFRVERSLNNGKTWTAIAYRPPRINGHELTVGCDRAGMTPVVMAQAYRQIWGPAREEADGSVTILAGGGAHHDTVRPAEIRWQMWIAAAEGAKGILFFTYTTSERPRPDAIACRRSPGLPNHSHSGGCAARVPGHSTGKVVRPAWPAVRKPPT